MHKERYYAKKKINMQIFAENDTIQNEAGHMAIEDRLSLYAAVQYLFTAYEKLP